MFWKLYATGTVIQLLLGFLFYGVGAIVMLIAYRYGKLSVLQPMLSLNYIFAIIIAWAVLNEPITSIKIVGIVIIVAGVVLIGGDRD
jgi:undecaprenyl phosphate-alpha-L-ara4N flippase subunit ArnE